VRLTGAAISAELLAREAIERAVDYDDWFLREVDAGQVLSHEAVGTRLDQKRIEQQSRR